MKQRSKKRQLRRRLMTGIFCISLFAADLASAIPVWAKEPVVAEEQVQETGEEDTGKPQNPAGGNQEGTAQNPDGGNGGEGGGSQTQNPEDGNGGDDAQNPDEGKDGDNAQKPDEGKDGDNAQNPDEGKDGEGAQNPEDEKDGDGVTDDTDAEEQEPDVPDGEETPGTDDQESVSENDPEEQEPSVSENDVEVLGEVRALAVPADAIASGTYKEITWVIDANGKLTVEGTGDFAVPTNGNRDLQRAPWYDKRSQVKSAVVKVTGMTDASCMFLGCPITSVNLRGFDTSTVTNMQWMFQGCSSLTSLDLSNFDTSNVTNMSYMFASCDKLTKLNISSFDTAKVIDMSGMFSGCNFTKFDVSDLDTKNVTDMSNMFSGCDNLTSLDVSGLDTKNVTKMGGMFSFCSKLASLDVSSLETTNVTDMSNMFSDCHSLKSLDVSSFDTGNVTNMVGMFCRCRSLTKLDLHTFDTKSLEDVELMFGECTSLKQLNVGGFDTSKVWKMDRMFLNCTSLTGVDLGSFCTSGVQYMEEVFKGCSALKTLDLHHFDTSNVQTMCGMFDGCSQLASLDLGGFRTTSVNNMDRMFSGCRALKKLDLSHFDTSYVTKMSYMFYLDEQLEELDLSNFVTWRATTMQNMFCGCKNLKSIDLSSFELYTRNMRLDNMFYICSSLTELDLSNFDFNCVASGGAANLLGSCNSLTKIYTPYNVKTGSGVMLPKGGSDKWYWENDGKSEETDRLPEGLTYSVLVTKNQKPEAQSRITARKRTVSYACGEEIYVSDLTVSYYGEDGSVKRLNSSEYKTNVDEIDTSVPGEKILTVSYEKDGTVLTAEVKLTVSYILKPATADITLPPEADSYIYDGMPKTPQPTVRYKVADDNTILLTEGTDYTLSYRNNVGAGEASPVVIIRGIGRCSGMVTKTFTIGKAASPAAETMDVIGAQCAQANPNRTIDLTGSFRACGKKTGYEVVSVEDPKSIFSKTPVTADIKNGVFTYGTKAAQEGDTASIKVKVSFANYKDAELTVRITMAAKKAAVISGITMKESVVYSGAPVTCGGEAVVKTEDGKDITGQVSLVYQYSGTMADGTAYPAQGGTAEPPVNAGSYLLTISVNDDNPDYAGSVSYRFTIKKADAVVAAKDMVVLMQETGGEENSSVPVTEYQTSFGYEAAGLLNGDALKTQPSYTVTKDEAGKESVTAIDRSKTGTYYIHPSGADAGMNYELAYKPGILTVSEERVAYTVTLDGMGHCDTFTKIGIKSGALLELTEEERTPATKEQGYVFAGWFKDKMFDRKKEWNFEADTVQSNLTLYACWLNAAGEDGAGLKLCVQEIPDLTYTGSAQKPAVTVYDSDGTTLLKAGKDYTVKYVRNTDAVEVNESGRPKETGGTAKVTNPGKANEQCTDVAGHFSKDCPYVVIAGKGNYKETIYRNFLILPAEIAADSAGQAYDTPLAAGFALKYTDQFVVNNTKDQKPFGSMKYKKAMKAGTDFTVSLHAQEARDAAGNAVPADWKAEGALNAKKQYTLPAIPKGYSGAFILTVTGKGNYAGTVIRKLYVSEKQKLMKNATITLGKNQKNIAYTGEDVLLTPGYYNAETRKYHKVTASGTVSSTAEANANDMFLVKAGKSGKTGGESLILGKDYTIDYAGTNRAVGTATMTLTGKNGYVGTKSVTFKITGTPFSAKTIDVRAYDAAHPNEKDWKASMPYTGRAVTQNQVTLATKATKKDPTSKELVYGEHYTIAYKNNVKKGTATMTFTAKPESGYSGSFKKTFKITAQNLSKERLTVDTPALSGVVYCKNGARLPFVITNEAGTVLREGTDYTVKYKNNNAVTTAQTPENKKPLMTVTGKGNYAGKVEVPFTIVQASLADALRDGTVTVSCAQVQRKNGMKFKDFKLKLMEGKKTLGMGETKDYVIDETGCTPEILKAYADAIAAGTALPKEPVVKVTGKGYYIGEKTIALGKYIYAEKLTAANLYVVVSEGTGQSIYTGGQVTPDVAVYYGEKKAVSDAKKDKVKDDAALTAQGGKYKLTKLVQKSSENAGDGGDAGNGKDADYTVSYGANVQAGKNKGSVTVTGAGRYGGSVTVKFEIGKKAIY